MATEAICFIFTEFNFSSAVIRSVSETKICRRNRQTMVISPSKPGDLVGQDSRLCSLFNFRMHYSLPAESVDGNNIFVFQDPCFPILLSMVLNMAISSMQLAAVNHTLIKNNLHRDLNQSQSHMPLCHWTLQDLMRLILLY
jgi:hypothetical protein